MTEDPVQLVPAVDRAARMLSNLRGHGSGRGISELARDLGIPKSSAFQIAATLVHHGLLERDDDSRRYRIGTGLDRLASGRGLRADVPALAAPHLQRLAASTGLTALLGVPTAEGTVLAARGDGPASLAVSAPVGFRLPARAGAFGKVFDAEMRGQALRCALEDLPRFTRRTITDAARYAKELRRVRQRGFAVDFEEYLDGIRAVASPVRDADDSAIAAICALGISARLKRADVAAVAAAVTRAAGALSADLRGAGLEPRVTT